MLHDACNMVMLIRSVALLLSNAKFARSAAGLQRCLVQHQVREQRNSMAKLKFKLLGKHSLRKFS